MDGTKGLAVLKCNVMSMMYQHNAKQDVKSPYSVLAKTTLFPVLERETLTGHNRLL